MDRVDRRHLYTAKEGGWLDDMRFMFDPDPMTPLGAVSQCVVESTSIPAGAVLMRRRDA